MHRSWFIQFDRQYKTAYGLMFVNGSDKRPWDIKFNPSDKVSIHTAECFVPIVFGTDLSAVKGKISSLKYDNLIICFNGKMSDLQSLVDLHANKKGWSFLLLNKGCSYEIMTVGHGHHGVTKTEYRIIDSIVKDIPAPKPEKKNANVSVQKPSVNKKANK